MTDRPPPRRGTTLIEVLTTVTVLTILLALAAGLIRLLIRLDLSGRDATEAAVSGARLARGFRDDAHRSAELAPRAAEAGHLALSLPDGLVVDYRARDHDLVRELRDGDRVRHREVYRLPVRSTVTFEATTESGKPAVALIVRRDPKTPEPAGRTVAELGRWVRLSGGRP